MTDTQRWLSRKYLVYRTLSSLWFLGAVWLYFYRIFITDQQVGFLDGMAFAIGLIAEVPSGALADKFGRDKIVRLGQILAGAGLLFQITGSSFSVFFAGQAVVMIGLSLVSGADEALFFGRLNFDRTSVEWRKLVTRGSQFALIGSLFATVIGGWLHTINPRTPWIMTGMALILSALVIWQVKDTRPRSARGKPAEEVKDYLRDIKTGFSQFRLPRLRLYVPIIVMVQGLFYATGYGLFRIILLSRFHFSPFWGSVVVAASSLITVGLLALMHKHAERMNEKYVLLVISLSAAAGLLLSLGNIGMWGFVVILVLYAGEHVLQPFMSEVLNNHAPEKQRATVLSVASFLRMLPYVCLAPIIGSLNTRGHLGYFLVGWAALVAAATLVYISAKKRTLKLSLDQEPLEPIAKPPLLS